MTDVVHFCRHPLLQNGPRVQRPLSRRQIQRKHFFQDLFLEVLAREPDVAPRAVVQVLGDAGGVADDFEKFLLVGESYLPQMPGEHGQVQNALEAFLLDGGYRGVARGYRDVARLEGGGGKNVGSRLVLSYGGGGYGSLLSCGLLGCVM